MAAALADPEDRVVRPRGRVTKPKTTTASLRKKTPVIVTIDLAQTTVRLFKNFKLEKSYTVAVGQQAYETPAGLHEVQYKDDCPAWTPPDSDWVPKKLRGKTVPCGAPNNPLKERFISFAGSAGFHGTSDTGSLGTAASHGCIRMAIPDVKDLYSRVDVGNPVYIG